MAKQKFIKDIETYIQNIWEEESINEPSIDISREKYLVTFPYPYMNGRLHLGHGFSVTKAEFMARYQKLRGKNVLFPFAFHCTGTPIVGCAKKLENEIKEFGNPPIFDDDEIVRQWNILKDMNVMESDIPNFVDPEYWIDYFPQLAFNDIQKMGLMVDTRRSFVTTKKNPFYDSFVKWQFRKLDKKGKCVTGIRPTIFADNQPCGDHDLVLGSDVSPLKTKLYKIKVDENKYIFCIMPDEKLSGHIIIKHISNIDFVTFISSDSEEIITTNYIMKNYKEQFSGDYDINKFSPNDFITSYGIEKGCRKGIPYYIDRSGFVVTLSDIETEETKFGKIDDYEYSTLFLPKDKVVSRAGTEGYVSMAEQWYLTYGDDEWKKSLKKYLTTFNTYGSSTKHQFESACEWLDKWAFSRQFGLGTKIPWDDRYLIDSLSDSTIYMSYYTICHILHKDLFGSDSEFYPSDFGEDEWDYILLGKTYEGSRISMDILNRMRSEFVYWYPVDLRVSGKDLIMNHLTMCLYNHLAIFPDLCPKSFFCNGYVMVNGKKMSKSEGNFIMLSDALDKYSVDSVRLTFAESGDDLKDANFVTDYAEKTNMLKIYKLTQVCHEIKSNIDQNLYRTGPYNFYDKLFLNKMKRIVINVTKAYVNMVYREVTTESLSILPKERESYVKNCKFGPPHRNLIERYLHTQITLIAPIIPHVADYLWMKILDNGSSVFSGLKLTGNYPEIEDFDVQFMKESDILDKLTKGLRKAKAKLDKRKRKTKLWTVTIKQFHSISEKEINEIVQDNLIGENIEIIYLHRSCYRHYMF